MSCKYLAALLFFVVTTYVFPQGMNTTLNLPVSPKSFGAGGTGTANIRENTWGFTSNPAYLGNISSENFISTGLYPGAADWFWKDLTYNSLCLSGGYNLQKKLSGIPLSIGAAISRTEFNFGSDDNRDYYYSYSLGIGYHSIINISAGITIKDVTSLVYDQPLETINNKAKAEVTAFDYGILFNIPLNNLLNKPLAFSISKEQEIMTDFNYNLGYSIQNIGDKVYYIDPSQAEPLGRTAMLAHNISLGFNLISDNFRIELVNFSYSIDAVDNLIDAKFDTITYNRSVEYQGMFGDIKPDKNLFAGKADNKVTVRKGMELEFGEAVIISTGGFDGGNYDVRKTSGYGIKAAGILKVLNLAVQSETLDYIVNHFNLQYYSSTYFKDTSFEVNIKGVMLSFSGF